MMVQQQDKSTVINIAIPIELTMDTDIDEIIDLKLGENTRVLECDNFFEIILLSGCDLDAIIKLLDTVPYFTLEKTYEEFFHTGVNLEIDLIVGLNMEMDL